MVGLISKSTLLCAAIAILIFLASFIAGDLSRKKQDNDLVFQAQAIVAYANHTNYERIKGFIEKKCIDAALTELKHMKILQEVLLTDNINRMRDNTEIIEYIRVRSPELLRVIQSGDVPTLESYSTICPP